MMEIPAEILSDPGRLAMFNAGKSICVKSTPDLAPIAWLDLDGNVSDNNDSGCFNIPLFTAPQPWDLPAGWQIVPEEPTIEMIESAVDQYFLEVRPAKREEARKIWKSMFAAFKRVDLS